MPENLLLAVGAVVPDMVEASGEGMTSTLAAYLTLYTKVKVLSTQDK